MEFHCPLCGTKLHAITLNYDEWVCNPCHIVWYQETLLQIKRRLTND